MRIAGTACLLDQAHSSALVYAQRMKTHNTRSHPGPSACGTATFARKSPQCARACRPKSTLPPHCSLASQVDGGQLLGAWLSALHGVAVDHTASSSLQRQKHTTYCDCARAYVSVNVLCVCVCLGMSISSRTYFFTSLQKRRFVNRLEKCNNLHLSCVLSV